MRSGASTSHRIPEGRSGRRGRSPACLMWRNLRSIALTHPPEAIKLGGANDGKRRRVAIHLTPTELAREVHMKRREVISKCMEMGVPIFNGRMDKTLFPSSLRRVTQQPKQPQAAAYSRFAEIAFRPSGKCRSV